jgi:hypothetical protein
VLLEAQHQYNDATKKPFHQAREREYREGGSYRGEMSSFLSFRKQQPEKHLSSSLSSSSSSFSSSSSLLPPLSSLLEFACWLVAVTSPSPQ